MRLKSKGFTLIEAMIAMVLLLVGILAVSRLFTAAVFARQKAQNLTIAQNVITAKFEDMRQTRFDLLQSRFPSPFYVTDPAVPTRNIGTGTITMTPAGTTNRVMVVTIQVEIGRVISSRTILKSTTYIAER